MKKMIWTGLVVACVGFSYRPAQADCKILAVDLNGGSINLKASINTCGGASTLKISKAGKIEAEGLNLTVDHLGVTETDPGVFAVFASVKGLSQPANQSAVLIFEGLSSCPPLYPICAPNAFVDVTANVGTVGYPFTGRGSFMYEEGLTPYRTTAPAREAIQPRRR